MSEPLVSVIVPLYNYQQYIGDCIRSIENQTYKNWELIVIDDCSTDKSYKVAKKLAKASSSNIKVISTPKNSGYSRAKNEGIVMSSGDYIVTLDADDMLTKNSIGDRIAAAIKYDMAFVHGHAYLVNGSGSLETFYKKGGRKSKGWINAQTVLMARWVHQKYGLYDESLRSRADKEMWWRLFGKHKGKKLMAIHGPGYLPGKGKVRMEKLKIDKYVAYYRKHPDSMLEMRRRNRTYNTKMTKILRVKYTMRQEAITRENTRFLDK